jgi:hypothetical protein
MLFSNIILIDGNIDGVWPFVKPYLVTTICRKIASINKCRASERFFRNEPVERINELRLEADVWLLDITEKY